MKPRILTKIGGSPVMWDGQTILFSAGMTIDADGSPRAYHPDDKPGLDYLANAGHPGNWWGIVTDGRGNPIMQDANDPAPGFCISSTAYYNAGFRTDDPRRYLDSEKVRFVVIPGPVRKMIAPVFLGCKVEVEYRGKTVLAVCGDIGPSTHLGEGSIALARALKIPSNARRGGVAHGVTYTFFPGVPAKGFELQPA